MTKQNDMPKGTISTKAAVVIAIAAFCSLVWSGFTSQAASPALSASIQSRSDVVKTSGPPQYPLMDQVADKLIQKYQVSTCDQLWLERAAQKGQPKSPAQQQAIAILHGNPQMLTAFIDKVAAPIATKMFECGMIP